MNLILYIHKRVSSRNKEHLTVHYINDYIDGIYPKELEIKDTTYAPK